MAILYRCDKCGSEGEVPKNLNRVSVSRPEVANTEDFHDLCSRCIERLRDWLQPDPKVRGR